MENTKLSSKGQVIIPKPVRDAHKWDTGTEFVIQDKGNGILLKPISPFKPTRLEDVFGYLRHKGKPLSLEEMDEAIALGARKR